ncbi:hypothetical protein BGZ63DRAFT_232200 [Mariannaea sp. PMI_226]|nr:hypothetical protein BGZ63DRAFT_232200 [Mariannaea sp. PMI_226]
MYRPHCITFAWHGMAFLVGKSTGCTLFPWCSEWLTSFLLILLSSHAILSCLHKKLMSLNKLVGGPSIHSSIPPPSPTQTRPPPLSNRSTGISLFTPSPPFPIPNFTRGRVIPPPPPHFDTKTMPEESRGLRDASVGIVHAMPRRTVCWCITNP